MTVPYHFSAKPRVERFGAVKPDKPTKRISFAKGFAKLAGEGEGQKALLWKLFEEASGGPLVPHVQPSEGDCVGQSTALACDLLAAADINMRHEPEKWVAKASVEAAYGGSKMVGGILGRGDGSQGEYAAKYVNQYGVLHRLKYPTADLTGYDARRSDRFGRVGVSDALLEIASEHPIATYTNIKTWKEARDAVFNGQPVIICSTYAFTSRRDADGFLEQYTGRRRKTWFHCMTLAGYDEEYHRPGGLIQNSWGPDWVSGPKRHEQPEGSFWASPEAIENMLQDWSDCYAFSSYLGHPEKKIKYKLYK